MDSEELRRKLVTGLIGCWLVKYLVLLIPVHPEPVAYPLAPASGVIASRSTAGSGVPTNLFVISTGGPV